MPGKLFYPLPTGKISDNLYCICDKDDANFFIYSKGNDSICIDAGYRNNNYVKADFRKIDIDSSSIDAIFLTHTDMDHAGALDKDSNSDWFGNAKIYMGKQEEDLIQKRQRRKFLFYTPIEIVRKYGFIKDEETKIIGKIKIKAIHTPGHTSGHMAYLVDDKILFTGDLLLLKNNVAEPFYHIWNMDTRLVKDSIKKVAKIENVETLCTAHSQCSFKVDEALKKWKK
jgi:glyoxylase-like metal-dependent hydrolase (beta-lactamase superfamily II)